MKCPTVNVAEIAEVNPSPPASLRAQPRISASFVPMADVSEEGKITSTETRPSGEVIKGHTFFNRGDILVAKITPCMENGKAAVADIPTDYGFGSTEFHVLSPGPRVDRRYLFYAVWNPAFRFEAARNMTGTAGQQRVPVSFLHRYAIPLPPLPEQKRIAALLDKADAIRRKRQESIRLADDFLHSAFLDMFGDPVTNPKGWPVRALGQLGVVQGGLQVTHTRAINPVEVPYLRVANVYRDHLDLQEVKTIRVTADELDRTRLAAGDLLIVEGHGNPDEIGRSAVWDGSVNPCVHQNHLIRVRVDPAVCTPAYVSAFMNSGGGRRQMGVFGKTTSGLNTISTANVKSVRLSLPPLGCQQAYTALLCRVKATVSGAMSDERDANLLFQSLSHRAFAGEL